MPQRIYFMDIALFISTMKTAAIGRLPSLANISIHIKFQPLHHEVKKMIPTVERHIAIQNSNVNEKAVMTREGVTNTLSGQAQQSTFFPLRAARYSATPNDPLPLPVRAMNSHRMRLDFTGRPHYTLVSTDGHAGATGWPQPHCQPLGCWRAARSSPNTCRPEDTDFFGCAVPTWTTGRIELHLHNCRMMPVLLCTHL